MLNAIIFYSTAMGIVVLAVVCWRWFEKNVPEAITIHDRKQKTLQLKENAKPVDIEDPVSQSTVSQSVTVSSAPLVVASKSSDNRKDEVLRGDVVSETYKQMGDGEIIKKISWLCVGLALNYVIYCLLFPLFILEIPCAYCISHQEGINNDWWNLGLLTTWMMFDFLGRMLPLSRKIVKKMSINSIIVLCYVRLVFLVLIPLMSLPQASYDTDHKL